MINIKGVYMFHLKEYYIQRFGQKKFDEAVQNVDMEYRDTFTGKIDHNGWYDAMAYECFLEVIYYLNGKEELDRYSHWLAGKVIDDFFSLFIKFLSLESILSKADKLWKKSFSGGKLNLERKDNNGFKFVIEGYRIWKNAFLLSLGEFFSAIAEKNLEKTGTWKIEQEGIEKIDFVYNY